MFGAVGRGGNRGLAQRPAVPPGTRDRNDSVHGPGGIVDSRTGARKLLDVEALEIVRVEKIIPAEAVRAESVRAETAPARHRPG